ncbi:MAG: NUDIX hydrolase [Anaerolineae bacterium]|nr:NUDIX hydrolase [Anaerolineae bacterium]
MAEQMAHGKLRPVCPACGFIHFADPKVAVVVFIEQHNRVLLVRRTMNPEQGKWALPAGFVDAGENPQDAAQREVREETGLEVAITRLVNVKGGPDSTKPASGASIVIIYEAQVLNGAARALDDADAVLWYAATDPLPDIAFASTRSMLNAWIAHQQN